MTVNGTATLCWGVMCIVCLPHVKAASALWKGRIGRDGDRMIERESQWQLKENSNQTKMMFELHPKEIHPWLLGVCAQEGEGVLLEDRIDLWDRIVDKGLAWRGFIEASCYLPSHQVHSCLWTCFWITLGADNTTEQTVKRLDITLLYNWYSQLFLILFFCVCVLEATHTACLVGFMEHTLSCITSSRLLRELCDQIIKWWFINQSIKFYLSQIIVKYNQWNAIE